MSAATIIALIIVAYFLVLFLAVLIDFVVKRIFLVDLKLREKVLIPLTLLSQNLSSIFEKIEQNLYTLAGYVPTGVVLTGIILLGLAAAAYFMLR